MGDGATAFSCSTLQAIGFAVTRVLEDLEHTENRRVYVSDFEASASEVVRAYAKAAGILNLGVTYYDVDQAVDAAREELLNDPLSLVAMGTLGLAAIVKPGAGADFKFKGLLDNELLKIPRLQIDEAIARIFQQDSKTG